MRYALACLTALLLATAAHATEPVRRGQIAAPYVPQTVTVEPAYKTHNWYVGGVGGYAWLPGEAEQLGIEDSWHGGIVAGYLWRSSVLGLGVEADYVLRDLGDPALDDGVGSVRGRAGVFVADGTFLYATAGVAEVSNDAVPDGFSRGLVVGGGIERDVVSNMAVRAEVLHYRHAEDYTEWGDHGSTAVRAGLVFKF